MPDILHRVGVEGSTPQQVYEALTTIDGLSAWWTTDTKGSTDLGGVIEFRFVPGGFDMEVTTLKPAEQVGWTVVGGPEEWVGTTITWNLHQEDDFTIVLFKHEGWREPVEFMHHCSTKWALFLVSLKALLETGKGAPSPDDFHIDNWN
ncbi:activator of HSP90 ATPase [Actinoplanes sp. OR16]|uniref:SRPBCC family protein n=1 Tax=Actinoplanes sp. OR16 TaxID=946334 RepID=UPI000F6C8223|nr:SRPBCC domain-containing protein [Actinoplanes sp. OR16]BBH68131.1 activator of HSP90 ATPase [Actinoplanes sp. OR16]